jgi:hypothetical protein
VNDDVLFPLEYQDGKNKPSVRLIVLHLSQTLDKIAAANQ